MKVFLAFLPLTLASEPTCADGSCAADEATLLQLKNQMRKHSLSSSMSSSTPLWTEHDANHIKCNDNVDLRYVENQEACQAVAIAAGHPYYSFRHNPTDDGTHKCFSSATCDYWENRNNEWRIYTATHYTAIVSWPAWAWEPWNAEQKGHLESCVHTGATQIRRGSGVMFTSCCTQDGVGLPRDCDTTKNTDFATAQEHCAAQTDVDGNPGRLCTASEAVAIDTDSGRRMTATQGCSVDGPQDALGADLNRLWTSTPCKPTPLIPGFEIGSVGACRTADQDAGQGFYTRVDDVADVGECAEECTNSETCLAFEFTGVDTGNIGCELHSQLMPSTNGHPNGLCYQKTPSIAGYEMGSVGACRTANMEYGTYSRADHVSNVDECAQECSDSDTCVAFEFVNKLNIGCELHRAPMPLSNGAPNGLCYQKNAA